MMKIGNKKEILEYLETAKEGVYKVCLHRYRRSIPQNSYLHLIFNFIEMHGNTGHTSEELKELMKCKFLKTYSEKLRSTYIRPTRELDSKEMTVFIQKIRAWCLDFLQLDIPDPKDHRMIEYYNQHPPK